jgi:hypothetical protein
VKSANSILLTYPPVSTGWQNITFVASDALGFTNTGGENYQGNFSRVYLQTNVTVTGFSSAGSPVNVSYLTDLPTYPTSATIKTEVWESTLSEDNSSLNTIALNSGFTSVNTVAYTANFTRTNIGTNENITVNMSVKDSWVLTTGSTNITAIGIDPSTGNTVGMILNTRRAVTGGTLDYFTADVPSQYGYFSRFVLAQFSGSGNIMQLITLAIGSQMSSQTASSHGSWSPPKASANAAAPAAVQNPAMPQANAAPPAPPAAPPAPPEIPKTANLYINANSVITQATTLQSNDNQATLSIGQGIVAHDPAGKTLSSVSITGMRSSEIPSAPAPKTYIFTGTAYDLQPSGATFSPAIMLTFVTPKAQWGEKYTVQSYDHTTNTWQSLPTTYDPSKGTISAQVSHFCCFALFAKQVAPASTTNAPTSVTPQVTPVPVPPAPTAVSTFLGIILWISETSYGHVYLVATIVIVFIALLFAELRRRRRRQDPLC